MATRKLRPTTLAQTWRQSLEVGDFVCITNSTSGRTMVTPITRTTVRMVFVLNGLRIMRRDGLNYGAPKEWSISRPKFSKCKPG